MTRAFSLIVTDTSPLFTLALADALDAMLVEATRVRGAPGATLITEWINAHLEQVRIVPTDIGIRQDRRPDGGGDRPGQAAEFATGRHSPDAWSMLRPMPDDASDQIRRVKLFRNGRNQAVRIPREFQFAGNEAIMRREGGRLILEPAPATSLLAVLASLDPLDEDFPDIADPAPDAVNL